MTITITGAKKLNAAQLASLKAECQRIDATHAGHTVAFTDEWDGDVLRRTVVAAAATPAEFQRLFKALDPVTRRRALMTQCPEAGVIDVPSVFLD